MARLQLILCDKNLVPLNIGPITAVVSARVILEQMDRFDQHEVVIAGSERRNLAALTPLTTVLIKEVGVGTIAVGLILDPKQQINDQGDLITLSMANITEQCRLSTTGLGYVRSTALGAIVGQIGALRSGWSATMTDTGPLAATAAPVIWRGIGAVQANGATLTKTGATLAFDAGGVSQQVIGSGDCSFTFQADSPKTAKVVGLTNTGVYNYITHSFYLQANPAPTAVSATYTIIESGSSVFTGTYVSGDQFTVGVESGTVVYRQNGGAVYRTNTAAIYPLAAACDLYSGEVDGGQLTFLATPPNAWWATRFEDAPVVGALLDLAMATFKHLRQAKAANGTPLRSFEFGSFGAAASLRLSSPDSGELDAIARNRDVRIITDITHVREASKLINVVTPLGGGQGDSQVTLRRCWKIVNDTTYSHYGVARYFPEYDPRFPISDPQQVIGQGLPGNPIRVTYDGRFQYDVWVKGDGVTVPPSYTQYDEMRGSFTDPTFTYVDASQNNQEMTERTLYAAAAAKLKWYSQPHDTYTVITEGGGALINRQGQLTRAGDLITVVYKRVGNDDIGVFTEMNTMATLTVMKVERTYETSGKTTDAWELSNLGRYQDNGQNTQSDQGRMIEAMRLVPTTSVSMFVTDSGIREIDAAPHTLTKRVPLPRQLFRVQSCLLQLDLDPARATINSASTEDGAHQHDVTLPALPVTGALPLHGHTGFANSHAHNGMNIDHGHGDSIGANKSGGVNQQGGLGSQHGHYTPIFQGSDPTSGNQTVWFNFQSQILETAAGQGRGPATGSQTLGTNDLQHGHTDSIAVAKTGSVNALAGSSKNTPLSGTLGGGANADNPQYAIASTLATTVLTNAAGLNGRHHHTLQPGIFDTDLTKSVGIAIDSGDGVYVDRTAALGGPWSASMTVPVDITNYVQAPGKTVGYQAFSLFVGSANPTSLCAASLSATWVVELSGIADTVYAA